MNAQQSRLRGIHIKRLMGEVSAEEIRKRVTCNRQEILEYLQNRKRRTEHS